MLSFDRGRFDALRDNYRRFYKDALGRPILPITFGGLDAGRAAPNNPTLAFSNVADFSITPEQVIDRLDYELSCCEWAGEGYPYVNMHSFGPGCAAAFMGCIPEARANTVWFHPPREIPITELHFEYNGENFWLRRLKDIYTAGMERWRGEVVMSMTDLGGVLDILSSFRTAQGLLCDLYDYPDEVLRCVNEIQAMWLRYFDEINAIIGGGEGYSSWAGIYSDEPTYILQSDFSYMIGPAMFDRFVASELESSASRMKHAFYHMDGIGQLPHLDSLLGIDTLTGIQWVCGDGEPQSRDWTELYKRIAMGGKKIQTFYNIFDQRLFTLCQAVGADKLEVSSMWFHISQKEDVKRAAYRLGLEI